MLTTACHSEVNQTPILIETILVIELIKHFLVMQPNHLKSKADLYILGTGVAFFDHISLETQRLLEECKIICTNLPDELLQSLPQNLRLKTKSFWHLYKDGSNRVNNYRVVMDSVLNELKNEQPIAWLTPGHPSVFDSTTSLLLKEGRSLGWKVILMPAISCIDTIIADLEYEVAGGLFIYDATSVVMNKIPLLTSVSVMLLQISVFFSENSHLTIKSLSVDLQPLKEYLKKYYAENHKCAFICSSTNAQYESRITWVKISDFTSLTPDLLTSATLWIPKIASPVP